MDTHKKVSKYTMHCSLCAWADNFWQAKLWSLLDKTLKAFKVTCLIADLSPVLNEVKTGADREGQMETDTVWL